MFFSHGFIKTYFLFFSFIFPLFFYFAKPCVDHVSVSHTPQVILLAFWVEEVYVTPNPCCLSIVFWTITLVPAVCDPLCLLLRLKGNT